ncbi:hypothetical protein HYFRA_00011315 [Hymenoscyphus fraxineus]|uniref:Uncharacterized protein n=1 Tax=Hymenoscyphus fraxineus TaxID=746836 RepID=A0A9N9L1H0_9HELO|nr:hypothetical protein HYFRA_00011315 [Hymenoscyphus fraxineus]
MTNLAKRLARRRSEMTREGTATPELGSNSVTIDISVHRGKGQPSGGGGSILKHESNNVESRGLQQGTRG